MKSTESRQLRNAAIAVAAVFALLAVASARWPATLAFTVWGLTVAAIHALYFGIQADDLETLEQAADGERERIEPFLSLPRFQRAWQLLLLGLGAAVTGWLAWRAWRLPLGEPTAAATHLGIGVAIAGGVLLNLLGRYAGVLGAKVGANELDGVAQLARFSFWVGAAVAACLALALHGPWDLRLVVGRALVGLTALLVVDAVVRAVLRAAYQPTDERRVIGPVGDSLVLSLLVRRSNPWEEVSSRLDETLGVELGKTSAFRFARRAFVPILVAAALLAWLSTAATVVPVGHAGVRVEMGRFLTPPVQPGLHWSLPWPFASVEVVPTRRVEEIVLGFERDTGNPILWAEKHYEGEKNLFVGDGDELLTISVPVLYRIRDPLAHLKTTTDAREALEHLAYRELLQVTSARDSFAIMTDERADVSAAMQSGLQRAADERELGLEIVWVGLRDVHPPVAVTPAFQDVISAEEERQTLVEQARAYAASRLPAAEQEAARVRAMAKAAGRERTLTAAGEAERFRRLAEAQSEHPEVFRERLRLEALEASLAGRAKLVVATGTPPKITLDARGLGESDALEETSEREER
ncbi:MAG: protease modulator HflK [Planctomycetota bacterium]